MRKQYFDSLAYSLFTMRRPLVGFWDLIHEKKGSLAAAHTIVVVAVIVEILRLTLTNFQFIIVNMEAFNVIIVILQVLLPLGLWVVANWSLTTLFDGKGKLSYIYMGTAYAMVPMVIINAVMIPVSHVITAQEGAIYWLITSIGTLWFVMLVLCAMMEIHDFTMSKTVLSSIFTLLAVGVIIFIFIMFFAVVSDGVSFIYMFAREIILRLQ